MIKLDFEIVPLKDLNLQKGTLPDVLPIELVPPTLRAATGAGSPATPAAIGVGPAVGAAPGTVGSPHLPPRGTATLPAKQPPPRFMPDKVC
jgi:hypothetical protein